MDGTDVTVEAPAWMTAALAYIPQWLGYQMRITEQPGCCVAVAHRGEVVLDAALGHADLLADAKLTPRHRFRVASHSKAFTASGVLKLREAGRLRLDDTVGQHVDGLHPDLATATIGQLLSHSAGVFRDGTDSAYWSGAAPFFEEPRLREDLALPPVIEANTRLKYSNHGYALAGLVIAAVTGEPWVQWTQREIVDAAGLKETTPDTPLPAGAKLARGHGGKALLGRRLVFPGDQPTNALAPATGFVSTAADLVRFFGQLAPNAATSVLSAASRREMTRPQWRDLYSPQERSYGLGIMTGAVDGWEWFGHGGGFQGYITFTAVVPEKQLAVSVLTNASDGLGPVWAENVLRVLQRFQTAGPPAPETQDWTGRWWSVWGATDLVPMGERVLLALPGMMNPFLKVAELRVTGPDRASIVQSGAFGSFGEAVQLVRGADGGVTELRIAGGRSLPEAALARELLERYGGGPE